MSFENTEQRLKKIIVDHYLSGSSDRLTIGELSARANISRQAFHKSYLHLKPFLTGEKKLDELLVGDQTEVAKTVLRCQMMIRECQAELDMVKQGHQKEYKRLEDGLITTLMNGDVLIHHSRELTNELKKKALHNEILKRQLLEKEIEVSGVRDRRDNVGVVGESSSLVLKLQADIREALERYAGTQDLELFYSLKAASISRLKEKLQRTLKKGSVEVVVYQNRFLSSFDKFVERHFSQSLGSLIVIDLPLATRSEVREFFRGLTDARPLRLFVPYCDAAAVVKAQRAFYYGKVPDAEFRSFDKEPLPTIQDGFDSVTVYRIAQGD